MIDVPVTGSAVAKLYHLGFAVAGLEPVVAELSQLLGLSFGEPRSRTIGDWRARVAQSADSPVFIELIEGEPGSPWHRTHGLAFDHLGVWSADVAGGCAALAGRGGDVLTDLTGAGVAMAMIDLPVSRLRLELVGEELRPAILGLRAMPGSA
jgi:hypothetical protein